MQIDQDMKKRVSDIQSNLIQFSQRDYWTRHYKSMIIKSLKLCLFLCIAFVSITNEVAATHIVGGELSYRSLGNDEYEITLVFRRDCELGAPEAAFDNPAKVWIFNGKGNIQTQLGVQGVLKMNLNNSDTLNNIIMSDCGFEGSQVCVHETIYRETVRLPYNPGDDG